MELKSLWNNSRDAKQIRFNRTFMELKLTYSIFRKDNEKF